MRKNLKCHFLLLKLFFTVNASISKYQDGVSLGFDLGSAYAVLDLQSYKWSWYWFWSCFDPRISEYLLLNTGCESQPCIFLTVKKKQLHFKNVIDIIFTYVK